MSMLGPQGGFLQPKQKSGGRVPDVRQSSGTGVARHVGVNMLQRGRTLIQALQRHHMSII